MFDPRIPAHISVSHGTADYVHGAQAAPPEWLVQSVAGADAARKKWRDINAESGELRRAWRRSSTALVDLRSSNSTTAELEEAERVHRDNERALEVNEAKARTALLAFDKLVRSDSGERQKKAAAFALDAQTAAAEHWEAFQIKLQQRDEAWRSAGAPGRPWNHQTYDASGSLSAARQIFERAVTAFDVAATERIAAGGDAPDHEAASQRAREQARETITAAGFQPGAPLKGLVK